MSDFIRLVTGSPSPFFNEEQEVKQETQSGATVVALKSLQKKAFVTTVGVQASPKHVLWLNRSLHAGNTSPELVNLEPEGLLLQRKSPGCLSPQEWGDKFPVHKRSSPESVNSEPEATRARLGTPSPRTAPSPLLWGKTNG